MIFDHGLENIVLEKTHEGGHILDLILTNNPDTVMRTTILPQLSDHHPVFVELSIGAKRVPAKPRIVSQYGKANWDQIKADLSTVEQELKEARDKGENINKMWGTFKERLLKSTQQNIPSKKITDRMRLEWVDDRLRRELKRLENISKKASRSGKAVHKAKAKEVKQSPT